MISLHIDNPSDADQRIDKFIKKYLPEAPLGGIYKWLRTGKIKVNRKKVEQIYRIELDDVIDIHLRDDEITGFLEQKKTDIRPGDQKISLEILYEDDHILIINKPPGMNVHPGDHKTNEVSLIELVQDMLGEEYNSLSYKPALVHRIDRDTSGAIMIAKDKKALDGLLSLLQSGKIEKIYHAIVIGTPLKPRDTIRAKLLRIENAKDEAKVQVHPGGQEAITHYETLQTRIHEKYSLLSIRIETGRTHQIRVHMASIGTPILGDKAYGDKSENSFARRTYTTGRQMLHARELHFIHPITKKSITVIAPYHPDMTNLIG